MTKHTAIHTLAAASLLAILSASAHAIVLPPSEDTSGVTTFAGKPPVVTKTLLTTASGAATTLPVSKTRTAFIRFDAGSAGITADTVTEARLTFFLPAVAKAGDLTLHLVTQDWQETFTGLARTQPTVALPFTTIPATAVIKKQFVIVNVTTQVKAWLASPAGDFGFAVASPDGIANVLLGAKEGPGSGYPAMLEIDVASTGPSVSSSLILPATSSPSVGVISQSGTPLLHTFGVGNFFAGALAGNFTMTGDSNTATGFNAFLFNTTGEANTASGANALYSNTTGEANTATGRSALLDNTTGSFNTATGRSALFSNQTGDFNTATGASALKANTTGDDNTATGSAALLNNTTGIQNTATGRTALATNTDGNYNTATGSAALFNNTTGSENTATGQNALGTNTTGSKNTANGSSVLLLNTTGIENTAAGSNALFNNTTGNRNTASGSEALRSNITGANNTASGQNALYSNTTGDFNSASGANALNVNTTGSGNTASGVYALYSNTTGTNNTAIGNSANVLSGNLTNATAIGAGAVVNASNKIRLGSASVTVLECQVGLTITSDRTKKENFLPVDGAVVLEKIRALELTSWNFIGQDEKSFRHYGPMAQDYFAAFGHDAIGTSGTETTINSGDMAGIMMSAIKELATENAALKQQLALQSAREKAIEARLARLEQTAPTTSLPVKVAFTAEAPR